MDGFGTIASTAAVTAACALVVAAVCTGSKERQEEAVQYGLPQECIHHPHSEHCHMAMYRTVADRLKAIEMRLEEMQKRMPPE